MPTAIWAYTFSGAGREGDGPASAELVLAGSARVAGAAGCCAAEVHPPVSPRPTARASSAAAGPGWHRAAAAPRVTVRTGRTLPAFRAGRRPVPAAPWQLI